MIAQPDETKLTFDYHIILVKFGVDCVINAIESGG